MFVLDSLLIGALRFVPGKLARAANAELEDASGLREWLAEARTRLERGEITEDEFVGAEREFVAALGRLRGAPQPPVSVPPGRGAQIETFDPESRDPD